MITFPPHPIPVIVEDNREGYILYIESGGFMENDIITVVHCEGGIIRHYLSTQVRIFSNATFGINKQQ